MVAGSQPGQDAARAAAEELSVLATVFKHLEFAKSNAANGQPHPATHLLQTAYPTLDALLQQQVHQQMCQQHRGWTLHAFSRVAQACECRQHVNILEALHSLLVALVSLRGPEPSPLG
jgi:hypothetical protein